MTAYQSRGVEVSRQSEKWLKTAFLRLRLTPSEISEIESSKRKKRSKKKKIWFFSEGLRPAYWMPVYIIERTESNQ